MLKVSPEERNNIAENIKNKKNKLLKIWEIIIIINGYFKEFDLLSFVWYIQKLL